MPARLIPIQVETRVGPTKGEWETGKMISCVLCGHNTFVVFSLDRQPTHLHFQCAFCDHTYCDNACEGG